MKEECQITFMELQHWHKHLFEKLGWMMLANEYDKKTKIDFYKYSIKEFLKHVDAKMKSIHDKDHKADLKILKENTMCLDKFVNKHFKKDSSSMTMNSNSSSSVW
jgi:hypothetical protein